MVSKESPPNPASNMLHQFIMSDSITAQNLANQHFDAYGPALRGNNTYPQSLGVLPSIQSLGERISRSMELVHAPSGAEESSEISHSRHLMDLLGASNENNDQSQRLSLSLNSHMLVPSVHYNQRSLNSDIAVPNYLFFGDESREACNPGVEHVSEGYSFTGGTFSSSSTSLNRSCSSDGTESFAYAVGSSRFLKPAQTLLEEVVNVGKNIDMNDERYIRKLYHGSRRGGLRLSSELKAELCSTGILSAEKHEMHLRIAKLISLLEEVCIHILNIGISLSVNQIS